MSVPPVSTIYGPSPQPYPSGPMQYVPQVPYPQSASPQPYPSGPMQYVPQVPYPQSGPSNIIYYAGSPNSFAHVSGQRNQYPKDQVSSFTTPGFTDHQIRNNFIAKVYLLLFTQMSITAVCVAICLFSPQISFWVRKHRIILYVAYAVFTITYLTLVCCANVRRSYPGNLIALFILTFAMSYLAAAISCTYTTASVLTTFLIACTSCCAISLFAICGCVDFTRCWAFFLFATIGFILFSFTCTLVYIFFGPQKVLHTVYGGIAAVLFMLYLAYDTQMVMGSRTFALSPEEYIFAATQLYMDLVNIFLILLDLVGERD